MPDKTTIGISKELRLFIEALVEKVILEGGSLEDQKKYLNRFCLMDGIDYVQLEKNLSVLFETAEELKKHESKGSERLLRKLGKECYLYEDETTKIISTINTKRSETEAKRRAEEDAERKATEEAEAKRRAEEDAERKASEEAEAKRRAEEDAERKAIEYANLRAQEAERRAKEEVERIRKEREEAERKAKEEKEKEMVKRMVVIHNGLLIIMVLLISYFEFSTFKKWGWAFIPLLVNIVYSFYRIINIMDYCYGKREFHRYEFTLSFITILIINIAAFCFPNAWSLAVLIPIPIISFIIDNAVHKRQREERMKTIHNGLLFTMVLLVSYIEFATFDSWGWAFVPLIVNIAYSVFRINLIEDLSRGEFKTHEFAWTIITLLIINVVAFCFPNAWSLAVLIPILIVYFMIDSNIH